MQILKNNVLEVAISSCGAELQSIIKDGKEYLWQGDPAFWNRRSPVLFPIVGSVWEKEFRVDGKVYAMGQHGFARDMEFEVVGQSETSVRYRLASSEETLGMFPYAFVLEIEYRIEGAKIDVIWEVTNPDGSGKELCFQIGAHPAFYYPDYDPETVERGIFEFDRTENLTCTGLKEKGCVDAEAKYPLPLAADGLLHLDRTTFDEVDTFVLENGQVGKVAFLKPDGSPYLTVRFDAPVLGLWSPPQKNAPFVCIEPWYGRCDRAEYTGEFSQKDWVNRLACGEKFRSVYTIELA